MLIAFDVEGSASACVIRGKGRCDVFKIHILYKCIWDIIRKLFGEFLPVLRYLLQPVFLRKPAYGVAPVPVKADVDRVAYVYHLQIRDNDIPDVATPWMR